MNFFSTDFGAFVLGRKILKTHPNSVLNFMIKTAPPKENYINEKDLWNDAFQNILSQKTKFGRIGMMADRTNKEAKLFYETLNFFPEIYSPKEKKRAEKSPKISFLETQIIHHMANEGFSDSVEFRRLARKFLRKAKHLNCDTIFFCEAIFGEEKTKNILQHLAGTQLKIVTPCDFLLENIKNSPKNDKQQIQIISQDNLDFTKSRAERILRIKLKETCVIAN